MITETLYQEINKLKIELAKDNINAVLIPHISPDGDAAGSCSALSQVLDKQGIKWSIISCDHFPEYLQFLTNIPSAISPQSDMTLCTSLIQNADYIFMLDHNTISREGILGNIVKQSTAKKVIIDHHLYPETMDIVISKVGISSTCELLYNVLTRIYGEDIIDKDIANSLYCGINTDTGSFNHSSSYPEVYRIVANLLEKGLDKEFVHSNIYQNNNLSRLRLLGNALLNKLEIIEEYGAAFIPITKSELEHYDYKDGDLEGLVNMPLSLKDINISVQIVQKNEKVKISFRSKGDIPINQWASTWFKGGGHKNAAGGHTYKTMEETIAKLRETLPIFLSGEYETIS